MESKTDTLQSSYVYGTSIVTEDQRSAPLKTYLFGYPIAHSLAPLLHSTLFKEQNVPWSYTLVESLDRSDFLPKLKASNCIGAAVTMPHKVSFMTECDRVTDEAIAIGAINTIFLRKHKTSHETLFIGTNTDAIGIREAFLQKFPDILSRSQDRPALVIGGGGACRSAVYALWKWLGASEIYLVNRLNSEVDIIKESFRSTMPDCKLTHVSSVEQVQSLEAPVVVVGCVPDIAPTQPGEILAKDIVGSILNLRPKGFILEMCYHPNPITGFLRLAEERGWHVIPGVEAMIHQGIAQQVLWLEKPLEDIPDANAKRVVGKEVGKHYIE
ncbi:NAD-P-binding protein [Phaeosphaeriaceae sp. SRC1lsM3a]|nr:NAD-P-binding protein [Stagonospora sp. SRC1lsM3a]